MYVRVVALLHRLEGIVQEDPTSIKIGELLVRAGVVTSMDLSEAEKLSKHMQMQFGRILIMSGCLTEHQLECALAAQKLIRDELLTIDVACDALLLAAQEEMPLDAALERLNIVPQYGTATITLAEVLLEAEIINPDDLEAALHVSLETNLPLAECLIVAKTLSPSLVPVLEKTQYEIRSGTLNREMAVDEIRATYAAWSKADESLSHDPATHSPVMKGEPVSVAQSRAHEAAAFAAPGFEQAPAQTSSTQSQSAVSPPPAPAHPAQAQNVPQAPSQWNQPLDYSQYYAQQQQQPQQYPSQAAAPQHQQYSSQTAPQADYVRPAEQYQTQAPEPAYDDHLSIHQILSSYPGSQPADESWTQSAIEAMMAAQHAPSQYEEGSFADGAPPAVVASEPVGGEISPTPQGILPALDDSAAMPDGLPSAQMMESQVPHAPAAERAATLFDAAEEEHKARALSFEPSAEGEHSLSAKTVDADEHLARLQAVAQKEQDLAALEENLHQREKQLLLQQEHLQAQADILQAAAVERERGMRQREESLRQREQQLTAVEGRMLAEESQIQMELDSVRSREAQLRIEEERIVEIENELRIRELSTSELEARLAHERELSQAKEAKSPELAEGEVYVSDLLEIAGFLHAGELDKAINNVLKHPASAVELLRFLGLVDEDALEALTECLSQMHDGELSASEVVQSLAEFRETGALSCSSASTQNEDESPSGGQAEFSALEVLDMSPPVDDAKEADDDGESHSTLASSDDQIQSLEPLPERLPESLEAAEPPNANEAEQAPASTFVVPVQDDKFTHTGIYDVFVDLDDPEGDPYYLAARAAIESDSLPKADKEPNLDKINDFSFEEAFSQTISAVMVEDLIEEPVSEKPGKASKDKKDKRKGRAQSDSKVEENRAQKQAVTESVSESPADAAASDESLKIQKKGKEAESVQKPSKKDTKGKSSKGKSRSRK